ncbi:MAG TPA: methyltransferase domain-containing protein, partial [Polyangiaceae bacterium]
MLIAIDTGVRVDEDCLMIENVRCVSCERGSLVLGEPEVAVCDNASCGSRFPIVHGVLDTLVAPDPEVVREIQGMAVESRIAAENWRDFKVTVHDEKLATLEERASFATDVGQYDRQTILNFEQALALLGNLQGKRVLEIGSDHDYYFLQRFREKGATCVAANIHFMVEKEGKYSEWPEKVLADMNNLPFRDGAFDVVLLSATSHHSPDLERTV